MSILDHAEGRVAPAASPAADGAAEDHFAGTPPSFNAATVKPEAVAVDLGSGYIRTWASDRRLLHARTCSDGSADAARPVRRGRITDPAAVQALLVRQLVRYQRPLAAGAVVVACRPVLTAPEDEDTARQVLTKVFAPSRILFLDTVVAAAIGAGAAPGVTLVADVGADLTEVAVVADGRVLSARRIDLGTTDLAAPTAIEPLARTLTESVRILHDSVCDGPHSDSNRHHQAQIAAHGNLLLVGGGARAELAAQIAAALGITVRRATNPSVAAVRGAGLAALSVRRRTTNAARA